MNSRQRILAALDNKQPDKVPIFELEISKSIMYDLVKLLGLNIARVEDPKFMTEQGTDSVDLYCSIVRELEIDATCSSLSMGQERIGRNLVQDKYGTIYNLSEHGEAVAKEGPIKDAFDIKGFDMVSKLNHNDFADLQRVINVLGSNRAHFAAIPCPFKLSWRLRGGMQSLLIDYTENPKLVHDLARISTDFYIAAADVAVEIGADAFIVVGDLAGEHNTLMSPEHFREYVKPYYKEIVEYVHQRGAKVIKHSDGNVWPILDELIEIGFDGIHPIQPQSMEIGRVKDYLAGKMCILGNIDCRNLLPFGTEEAVENSVSDTIRKIAPGGGYIITSSNTIHPGCKPENYVAMVRAAHKYGKYNR